MINSTNPISLSEYDTSIMVIGALKDSSVIYKVIDAFFSERDTLYDLLVERNELALRTMETRTRVLRAMKASFLNFKNEGHKALLKNIFAGNVSVPDKELFLFWQYALSNRLFREISSRVFCKVYFSGRASLSKEDIVAYLKEFLTQNKQLDLRWSEGTLQSISTKYLNLMTKLNLLEGLRVKSFKHIRPSSEAIVLFLYFADLQEPNCTNILKNEMLPLSFIATEDIQDRLKKLSLKGYFNMTFNGVALNIELTHSYKDICNVLYHRP